MAKTSSVKKKQLKKNVFFFHLFDIIKLKRGNEIVGVCFNQNLQGTSLVFFR